MELIQIIECTKCGKQTNDVFNDWKDCKNCEGHIKFEGNPCCQGCEPCINCNLYVDKGTTCDECYGCQVCCSCDDENEIEPELEVKCEDKEPNQYCFCPRCEAAKEK
jgi:hypothetical protein